MPADSHDPNFDEYDYVLSTKEMRCNLKLPWGPLKATGFGETFYAAYARSFRDYAVQIWQMCVREGDAVCGWEASNVSR